MENDPQAEVPLRERPIQEVASVLQTVLGQKLSAYAIQERNPKRIGVFARGEDLPDEHAEAALRDLAELTEKVTEQCSPELARAFMIGMNSNLDEQAPLQVFHQGGRDEVLAAATNIWDSDYL